MPRAKRQIRVLLQLLLLCVVAVVVLLRVCACDLLLLLVVCRPGRVCVVEDVELLWVLALQRDARKLL